MAFQGQSFQDTRPLGVGCMFAASFLAARLAGPLSEVSFMTHLIPFIFFPIGAIAIVANLHDAGKPYKHRLLRGYLVGFAFSISFAAALESWTFLPIAIGMAVQAFFMTLRAYESSSEERKGRDASSQDRAEEGFGLATHDCGCAERGTSASVGRNSKGMQGNLPTLCKGFESEEGLHIQEDGAKTVYENFPIGVFPEPEQTSQPRNENALLPQGD